MNSSEQARITGSAAAGACKLKTGLNHSKVAATTNDSGNAILCKTGLAGNSFIRTQAVDHGRDIPPTNSIRVRLCFCEAVPYNLRVDLDRANQGYGVVPPFGEVVCCLTVWGSMGVAKAKGNSLFGRRVVARESKRTATSTKCQN